jgi:hypothetical protein
MRDLYSDDYGSVAGPDADRLLPEGIRRLTGAAIFVGLIAGMGLWSYRLGTRDAGEVPVIRAIEGPTRVEPADPGGLQAAHQGLEVNAVLAGRPAVPASETAAVAPAPEALTTEDVPQGELVLSAPAVLAERVMAEGTDLPMPQEEGAPDDLTAAVLPEPEPLAAAPVLGEDGTVAPPAAEGPRPRNRPAHLVVARAKPKPTPVAATAPVERKAPPAAETKVAAAPPATAPREASGVKTGSRLVQLGAFDSEEITRKAWSQLVARNGDLLGSKSLYVERTTANARVFYRLRVAGFASSDETRQMCEALRARGIACIPVTLQ